MSRLQHALHALPPNTLVSHQMERDNLALNALLRHEASEEALAAKQYQVDTGCSWSAAIAAIAAQRAREAACEAALMDQPEEMAFRP